MVTGNIMADGKEQSMQKWLKNIYDWFSVQTYVFAIKKDSGKTLSEIRGKYLAEQAEEDDNGLE